MQINHILSPIPVLLANLGSAVGLSGQSRRIIDAGPDPGIELVSDGTIWRPRGGRQKIYKQNDGTAKIANLSLANILTSPTFPGGLMRLGFALQIVLRYQVPGIGTASRMAEVRIGAAGSELTNAIAWTLATATSGVTNEVRIASEIIVRNISGVFSRSASSTVGYYGATQANEGAGTVNFNNPWNIAFNGQSCAETAESITSSSWAAGEVTFGYAATPSAKAVGDVIVVSGMTPSGYNGTYTVTSVPDTLTWKAALASDPGTSTVQGASQRTSNVIIQSVDVDLVG